MRNLLLSAALIALPVGAFSAIYSLQSPAPEQPQASSSEAGLGDMSRFMAIATDVQKIVATGDMSAAETRITDFETAWDDAEAALRPINTAQWGNIDVAADAALDALRAKSPNPAAVRTTLTDLRAQLADPSHTPGYPGARPAKGAARKTLGVTVTDGNGRALPCEMMLDTFRAKRAKAALSDSDRATVDALQTNGVARCSADDDARADDFFAQGIALMPN